MIVSEEKEDIGFHGTLRWARKGTPGRRKSRGGTDTEISDEFASVHKFLVIGIRPGFITPQPVTISEHVIPACAGMTVSVLSSGYETTSRMISRSP
jgi:hypothetical protein